MTKTLDTSKSLTLSTGKTVRVGQFLLSRDGDWYRISDIDERGEFIIQHKDGGEWHQYGDVSPDEFIERDYIVLDNYEQALAIEKDVFENTRAYLESEKEAAPSDETAIVATNSVDTIKAMAAALEDKRQMVETARRMMKRRADQVRDMVSGMETKIRRLHKVLAVFEMYLGVNEDIIIVRDGPRATPTEPVSFRQMVLFMDEEVGDADERRGQYGIDFRSVEDFDAWLVADPLNLQQVLPERRGLVLIRPSRQKRHYSDNPLFNAMVNSKNQMTYVLVRNGDAIFRIWTGEKLGPRLFPKMEYNIQQERDWWEREEARDNDVRFAYRRNAMLLQGLLDRTEVFQPLPGRINLFDPGTYGDLVRFIRDDEDTLPSGRPPFREWQKQINQSIGVGSRIVFALSRDAWYRGGDHKDRFLFYANSYPPAPQDGIYQVSLTDDEYGGEWSKHGRKKERKLRILYNPGDEVSFGRGWQWDPHPRKNRVSFIVYPTDPFILNYDQVELDDIDFYLSSRVDRPNYLSMVPLLWTLRKELLAEREKEKDFVRLVAGRTGKDEAEVWEAVSWYKFTNQWKRRVDEDDAKALRMIERKLGKEATA